MRLTVPEQAAPRAGMRSIAAAIAFAFALPLAGAADGRPGVDAYFDAMAIAVKPGEQRQFVVGDNLAGYFEGYTQSGTRGQGYQMKQATVLRNYASFVDGRLNERGDSQEQVLPYGHRVRYASGATEEMALLSKQYALAMRVTAPSAAELAIAPLLAVSADGYRIERVGDVVIFTPRAPVAGAGYPQFLALAADRDFVFDAAQLKLKSAAATSLTVVAAFGNSAEEAAAHARALAHGRPIEAEKRKLYAELTKSYLATDNADYNKALNWAKAASRMFVVEEFGTGIWAGLPWFRDNWGRDSFIALPGTLLVSGQFDQAKAVLANFARYQNLREPRDKQYGRIPNRV